MFFFGVMFFFIILEFFFPYRNFGFLKKGFFTDLLWYSIAQGIILQILVFKYFDIFYSQYKSPLLSYLPVWGQCVFLVFFLDFIDYWMHRLSHAWFPMWRTHELHHSTLEMNWLSGSRQHWLELIMIRGIGGGILALLGASETALIAYGVSDMIMGPFTHSNLKIKIGPLKYFFNSPEMHRIHHSDNIKDQFSNYANKFALWDWLFGTAQVADETKAENLTYGIGYYYPQNFLHQLVYIFRKKETDELLNGESSVEDNTLKPPENIPFT